MELEEQKILKRLSKAIESKNQEQIALQYNKLGDLRILQGCYKEALVAFKESLNYHKLLDSKINIACAHRMVGEAYVALAKYEKALEHQKLFLKLAKEANDKVEQQRAWASIGRAQMLFAESKGEEGEEQIRKEALSAAKNAFFKSLAIATTDLNDLRKRELMEMKARLMLNLGLVHDLQGQEEEALKKVEKAVELCQANELYEDHCRSLETLSSLKHRQGDSEAALNCLGQALRIAKRLSAEERSTLTCDILVAQAEVFLTMGDFSSAKHALHKAYKMGPKVVGIQEVIEKNLKIAVAVLQIEKQLQEVDEDEYYERKKLFEKMADCASEVKAYTTAINYYKKMLECSEILGDSGKDLSAPLFSLGQTYKDNRQYPEAIEYFERDNDVWVNNPEEACKSLQELASVYKLQGNEEEHLATLERARVQALLAGSKTLQLVVLKEIASHHRSRGNSAAADVVDDEILELRGMGNDSEGMSSQDMGSSQEQGATNAWESVDIRDLSPDNSESDSELQQVQPTRLRQRNQCRMTKNEKGETALHRACINGKIDQVQKLLDAGHPVNPRDNAGWTPLHEAANHGFRDIVEILLEYGANVSDKGGTECDGLTPLHDAASNGCMDVMELLLDKGADVTARTYKKPRATPLDYFTEWYTKNAPLDEDMAMAYENLARRMRLAMERAGFNFNGTDEGSGKRVSKSITTPALRTEKTDFSVDSQLSQPSTSKQGERRKSYEDRAIMKLKRPNPRLIMSSGASSQSDEESRARVGALRRKPDSRKLNYDDEDEGILPPVKERRRTTTSSDSDEEIPAPSQKRSNKDPRSAYSGQSAREYQDVMETIRGKHRHIAKGPEPFIERNKPALLHEDEIEIEWLEDDLSQAKVSQPQKRKRVTSPTFNRPSQKSLRSERATTVYSFRTPSPECEAMDADSEDVAPPSPPRRKASPIKRSPRKIISPVKSSPKKISSPYKYSQRPIEQVELTSIKVRVGDILLLVPIATRGLTIDELANEIAQRYYRQKGLLPKLTLLTKDGALLSPEDPVTVIINSKEEEVQARVDSMTLPPISARYKEACHAHNIREDSLLLTYLESCQVTLTLQLSCLSLDTQRDPLLQALSLQQSLRELHLPGCALGDTGIEKLCPAIEGLEQLSSLDLSCNNFTTKGLAHLKDIVCNKNALKNLKMLDLSHNPFEYEGLIILGNMLEVLNSINRLNIRDCDLNVPEDATVENLPMFNLDELSELDVSYNRLGCTGLGYFFGKVDAWQISQLKIASTTALYQEEGSSAAKEVALLLQGVVEGDKPRGIISHLDISDCKLADVDVYEMLRAMNDASIRVNHLSLSSNTDLTAMCLRQLLQHQPTIPSLTLSGCPRLLYPVQACDLPDGLASLIVSNTKNNVTEELTEAWKQAKDFNGVHRCGPAGFLHLYTMDRSLQ